LLRCAALRFARCGAGQIVTPVTRHARCRAAECDEVIGPARPPRQSLRLVARRPQRRRISEAGRSPSLQPPRQASWHVGRDAASPEHGAARAPVVPPRSPQLRPRRITRGTCGGIFKRWAGKLAHCFGC
jgi:hypothetical protein